MNIFGLLVEWGVAGPDMRSWMVKSEAGFRDLALKFPDLAAEFTARADEIAKQVAIMDAALTPDQLGNLAVVVAQEIRTAIATKTLDPRSHPSDLAG